MNYLPYIPIAVLALLLTVLVMQIGSDWTAWFRARRKSRREFPPAD